ncbi:MAG: hypothetical protein QXT43_02100, partial [Candidatus Micrarchaeaceae archaeon]
AFAVKYKKEHSILLGKMYVLIDTSSILFAFRNKNNIFALLSYQFPGVRLAVSQGVKEELAKLSKSKKRISASASVALKEAASNGVEVLPNKAMPDAWLLDSAKAGVFICTNDIALKRKLKAKGATVFSVTRSGKIM